ncbi:MAG: DUF928 domain-containing protein [Bacteroidota bacterium]
MMSRVINSFLLLPGLTLGLLGLISTVANALPPIPERHYPPQSPIPSSSRDGGGRRGDCPSEITPMIAIVSEAYWNGGLTQSEHPTLWIRLPFDIIDDEDHERAMLLTLRGVGSDESDYIFREVFRELNLRHGLVGLPLASTDFVLPLDQTLVWSLSLYCDAGDDLFDYSVSGWIARVEEPELNQLVPTSASAVELSDAYRDNGLWYDALNVLTEALQEETAIAPSIRSDLQQLLLEGELEPISDETPIQYLSFPD